MAFRSGTHPLMSQLRNDVDAFMRTNSDLLFNECELQIRLTNHLDNSGHYDKVYVEYAVPIKELQQRSSSPLSGTYFPWKSNLYVDIVVEKDGKFAAVELKYTTYPVNHTITRFGQPLLSGSLIIKNQAAIDIKMYDYWKDVRRIEVLRQCYPSLVGGIALLVTNNSAFWNNPKTSVNYAAFSTHQGNTVGAGVLSWGPKTVPKLVSDHPDFMLQNGYFCDWGNTAIPVLTPAGVPFRYLLTVI